MIVVCESQCWGFEHVVFNAAFLESITIACPGEMIEFLGEKSHVQQTREQFSLIGDPSRIMWVEIDIPERFLSDSQRLVAEFKLFHMLRKRMLIKTVKMLVVTSITSPGLIALKTHWALKADNLPEVLVVLHGVLNYLLLPRTRRPLKRMLGIYNTLTRQNFPKINYIVLGESIQKRLLQLYPKMKSYVFSINHPYIFSNSGIAASEFDNFNSLNFGYVGVGAKEKGIELFFRVAKRYASNAVFTVVGRVNKDVKVPPVITGYSTETPIERQTYERLIKSLTYVVLPYSPRFYQLVASGAMLDAVAFAKPIIVLANPYFETYFKLRGDIGFLCQSEEELITTIEDQIENFDRSRYDQQVRNISALKKVFSPQAVAVQLQEIPFIHSITEKLNDRIRLNNHS